MVIKIARITILQLNLLNNLFYSLFLSPDKAQIIDAINTVSVQWFQRLFMDFKNAKGTPGFYPSNNKNQLSNQSSKMLSSS